IGNQVGSSVGSEVTALNNGNYVVGSWLWDNGVATNAGAITWGNGTTGTTGIVSAANSLVGTHMDDYIGSGIVALANGNYVAISTSWDDGAKNDVGAVTWGDGTMATSGNISIANSLIGFTADDQVGFVTALNNGNYLVSSTKWDNGPIVNAGAATFANGSTGISGYVSAANSLVGTTNNDYVGYNTQALTNGNYVVGSFNWDNGAVQDAGAVTWGNGTTGTFGTVSTSNSLVGSTAFDYLGLFYEIIPLPNGNYVVGSPYWDNGSIVDAGAVTWLNGATSTSGIISPSNSLVGSTTLDKVGMVDGFFGDHQIKPLSNGNFIVISPEWKNTPWNLQGAVTYGTSSRTGVITSANSVLAGYGEAISLSNSVDYDAVNDQMVVGLPGGNKVVFFRTTGTFADVPSGYWAEDYIERLYNAGITGGCGVNPLIYCPTNPVTRAQMAVFLEKGLHGSAFTPPNVAATFGDTAGHWAEDWIEALKADGVTSGCGVGIYCPENSVTRDQMAVFLLKAKHGSAYTPPAVGASTGFSDVPTDHWAAAWIKQLAAEAITGGCGGGNYCPANAVTRDQMAVFLVKTFDLP
ncbi:MAG: S-layer homology domain-containing protein, partial [Anaerolineales bacterium]|nr:S-layer homology domain-containing protein [Anaerolineales bacterium]